MPWKIETPPDQQREDFVREALRQEKPFKELCQQHLISRKTGYKWLKRSGEEGSKSLGDRRRGPRQSSIWRVPNGSFGFWNRKKASQLGIEKTICALEANVLRGTDSLASDDKPN